MAPTEDRRYRLGFHLYALGSLGWSSTLRSQAYAIMRDLRDAVDETVQLDVLDGEEIVCLERMEPLRSYYELTAWRVPRGACPAGALLGDPAKRVGPPAVHEDGSGIIGIAAPIHDQHAVVAALSIVAPAARLTRTAIARHAPLLSEAVTRLSGCLGHRGEEAGRLQVVVGDASAWTE